MVTLKNRLIKGLFASGFGQAVTILTQLAGVPLFLHFWGVEKYGAWLILSTVPAYLAISDFGFSGVAANDMTMNAAAGRKDVVIRTFQSILAVIAIAALVTGLIVVAVVALQFKYRFLPIESIGSNEAAIVIAILWLQVIVGQIGGALYAGYRCDGNFAIGMFYGNLIRLLEFIFSAAALLVGAGLIGVALSVLAVRIIGTCGTAIDLTRRSPWLLIGLSKASNEIIRRLVRPSLAFLAFPLGHAINQQGVTLVVGSLMGAGAVVIFSTYRTLTRLPWQMMNMINVSVWPELSHSIGAHDITRARKLHRISVAASFWSVLLTLTGIYFLGTTVIRIWTSGHVPELHLLLFILEVVVLVNSIWSTSSVVPASSNQHEKIALTYLAGSVAAVAISSLAGRYYALPGVAGSLVAIDICMIYFVLKQSVEITSDKLVPFATFVLKSPSFFAKSLRHKFSSKNL